MAATPTPILLANARVIDPASGIDEPGSVLLVDGHIAAAGAAALNQGAPEGTQVIDVAGAVVAPGLIDIGVTVGEPGGEHRETLASASQAAAASKLFLCFPVFGWVIVAFFLFFVGLCF